MATRPSTVYGPVQSWRVGRSLGIDLIRDTSVCSFQCVYCQLGQILEWTGERRQFVPTAEVMRDLQASNWQEADVITFSGNGEPTLATNLGEVIRQVKAYTGKPVTVLTNALHLGDPQVQQDLMAADKVFCKLDAATDEMLARVNRPISRSPGGGTVGGACTVRGIVEGIKSFRQVYQGHLAIQTMFMPMNKREFEQLAALYQEIQPDEVQLNTPLRPVPRSWYLESRGNHEGPAPVEEVRLKAVTRDEAHELEEMIRRMTGLKLVSVYREPADPSTATT